MKIMPFFQFQQNKYKNASNHAAIYLTLYRSYNKSFCKIT